MSRVQITTLAIVSALVLLLPACGGSSGGGFAALNNPLRVTSSSIPPSMSGEPFQYVIPLDGGCDGPYVMKLINGRLPAGLSLVDERHSIEGNLLEDGSFDFTVEITDSGCTPFQSTVQSFSMLVGVGEIAVVDVLLDGNPSLVPADSELIYPDFPALPEVVYNEFTSLQFVVAGGVRPYRMSVYDDPQILGDGPLPLGVTIPTASTSIVGSPVQVGDGGLPFLVSYRITDAVGNEGFFTAYWLIETPPIIVATASLGDGQCGEAFSEQFFVAEGVPPFVHDLVADGLPVDYTSDSTSNPNMDPDADVIYRTAEGLPPQVNPEDALVQIDGDVYPPDAAPGPDYDQTNPGAPPEGIYLVEATGAYIGMPRRMGTFLVNYHVQSSLVPNNFGQHAWASFKFSMAIAPELQQDPAYTDQGIFLSDPASTIPELEKGAPYNPDGGDPRGLDLLAYSGVPNDGKTDAPLESQLQDDPTETEGSYDWTMDYDPEDIGLPDIPATICWPSGVFGTTNTNALVPQPYQTIAFTVTDAQLPNMNEKAEMVQVAVGPDVVVVTESTTPFDGGTATYASGDLTGMTDIAMRLKIVLPLSTAAQKRPLNDALDLAATTSIPDEADGASLRDMLGGGDDEDYGVDLLRVSINPAGWWEDAQNFNPKGAKGLEHADANRVWNYRTDGYGYDYNSTSSNSYGYSGSYFVKYGTSTEVSAVRLPDVDEELVDHDPANGVYADGGKLYAFDSDDYFGVFVIRQDSKFYVPLAFEKGGGHGWNSFGDNWLDDYDADDVQSPVWKIPQMAVSPDGRFAVMKLNRVTSGWWEATAYKSNPYTSTDRVFNGDTADDSGIVLFSLTGEPVAAWGGATYKIIDTGANGSEDTDDSTGHIMFAPTMVLSNSHLYYVCGLDSGTGSGSGTSYYSEFGSWRHNWIYRYDMFGGGDAGELLESTDSDWANEAGVSNSLQMPMQRASDQIPYGVPSSYSYTSGSYWYMSDNKYRYTNAYQGSTFANGYNVHEGSKAPMPFRVNANGDTVAIVASQAFVGTGSSTSQWRFHLWVDDGSDDLEKISSEARIMTGGGSRGSALRTTSGSYSYARYAMQWGIYGGPTTQLEISDDGTKIAAVCHRATGSYSYSSYSQWYSFREDVIAWEKDGSSWDETQITGSDDGADQVFASPILWRFGALIFTKANDGLIFWGGASGYDPDYANTTYQMSSYYTGSMYAYAFSGSRAGSVIQILDSTDGGLTGTSLGAEFDSDDQVDPSYGLQFSVNRVLGAVIPMAGFMSPNRDFYYIVSCCGLNATADKQQGARLFGINVRSLDSSQSAGNGRKDGYCFVPEWPNRRGFTPTYQYYAYYGLRYAEYAPADQYGTQQVMTRNGRVFYGAHYQPSGPSFSTYSGSTVPTYYGSAGYRMGQVAFFDSNTGGDSRVLTTLQEDLGINTNRAIKYLEATDDGTAVAFVYSKQANYGYLSTYYPLNQAEEQLGYIGGIQVDANGDVDDDLLFDVHDLAGNDSGARVSTGITNDSLGRRVIYALGQGNENKKNLYITTPQPDGSSTPRKLVFSNDPKRYNVLHSGR